MKYIGIKLADGSFYSILEEGKAANKLLDLTTVQDNQTTVQIDLYRSATNSMEDAEYVDTLEIKHLKPHPNGEPDLQLTVSINENNELNAEIIDPETGKTSETQVTLVSRTLAERNAAPVNFAIDNSIAEPSIIEEPLVSDDNTLVDKSAGDTPVSEKTLSEAGEEDISFDQMAAEIDIPVIPDDTNSEEKETPAVEDLDLSSLDDTALSDEELANIEKTSTLLNSSDESADTVKEDIDVIGPSPNNEDFSFDDLTIDVNKSDVDKKKPDVAKEELKPSEFDTTEFNNAVAADTLTVTSQEKPAVEEPAVEENSLDDISNLDLPDFTESPDLSTETVEEKTADEETKQLFKESDYSVPDFDQTTASPSGLTDYFEDSTFKEPVFSGTDSTVDETEEKKADTSQDDVFADTSDDGDEAEDDGKKKTKTPVIICIVCAIICVIATLLILFVIPSKLNLLTSREAKEQEAVESAQPAEPVAPTEPAASTEPATPAEPVAPAKEDEIVVAPTPEVVPEAPAKPEEPPADITYKIKWGDTLWDICDAYYKNPWRYKKLAKYNHIRNPDLIISGTYLLIPAE